LGSTNGFIVSNLCRPGSATIASTGQSFGVEIEDGTTKTLVQGNNIAPFPGTLLGTTGGVLVDTNDAQAICGDIIIDDNVIDGCDNDSIFVSSQYTAFTTPVEGCHVTNNRITNSAGGTGIIRFTNAQHFIAANNTINGSTDGQHAYSLNSCKHYSITGGDIANIQRSGIHQTDCSHYEIANITMQNLGLEGVASKYAAHLVTTTVTAQHGDITNISFSDDQGTSSSNGFFLGGATDLNLIGGGSDGTEESGTDVVDWTSSLSSTVKISGVKGFKTTASGVATISSGTATTGDVNHGLDRAPTDNQVRITPLDSNSAVLFAYTPAAQTNETKFRIISTANAGADALFSWEIIDAGYEG
jgi:hypothetical protein